MKMLINGEWIDTKEKRPVLNPYTGEEIDTVPIPSPEHVEKAVNSADKYDFSLSAWDRYEILMNFANILYQRKDEFAKLITLESGKPIKESYIEVERAYQTFILSAEEAKRIDGEVYDVSAIRGLPRRMGIVLREPIGIVVAITPFNYPLNIPAHKVAPAIAANNPVILKPSPHTPITALKMGELLLEAGLPPSMIHIIPGGAEVGELLVSHPLVRKITFTGGVETGRKICKSAGIKDVCLELGGNDPLIILSDADIEKAVERGIFGAFSNNGQRCTSVKRIFVEERIADDFIQLFSEKVRKLSVGNPMDPKTDIGPLIDEWSAEKIERRLKKAKDKGGKIIVGGKRKKALLWPTVVVDPPHNTELVCEETFGPVAPIIKVKNIEEAVELSNSTRYGLQAGIFTKDIDKIMFAVKKLKVGGIVINDVPSFRAEHLPFGGVKESGVGREGVRYAVKEMTVTKTVIM